MGLIIAVITLPFDQIASILGASGETLNYLQDKVVGLQLWQCTGTVIIPVLFVLNSLFGLTGVIWSLLIKTVCAFLAMFIVYSLRNRLTVDKASLIEVE